MYFLFTKNLHLQLKLSLNTVEKVEGRKCKGYNLQGGVKLKRLLFILILFGLLISSLKTQNFYEVSDTQIHFLNTGNSDCIFIQSDKNILIDAAENDDESYIIQYLRRLGIKKLDYVLSTHPHADHIGSLDAIIKEFPISELLICEGTNTTKEYKDFMNAIDMVGGEPQYPYENRILNLGQNVTLKLMNCILPNTSDKNDWSIVSELVAGGKKILLMADAQMKTEDNLMHQFKQVDVLKAGHHGDITSSSEEFINKIKPKNVIITTGENPYGHPSPIVLDRFNDINATVYRTDVDGTIICDILEGKDIVIKTED